MTRDRSHPCPRTAILAFLAVSAFLLLSACAQLERLKPTPEASKVVETSPPEPAPPSQPPPEPPPPKRGALYQWYGDGRTVSRIEIDVDKQKAVFYDGPYQIGWTRVASGIRSYPTPTGNFSISEKVQDKRSNLYGKIVNSKGKVVKSNAELGVHRVPAGGRFEGAKMPYFLRLTNDGIGMHAGPIPKPGRPASHGCIRMPHAFAPVLYKHVAVGTPVSIVGSGPSYGKYLATQRRKKPEGAPAPRSERPKTQVASASRPSAAPKSEGSTTATTATSGSQTTEVGSASAPAAGSPSATGSSTAAAAASPTGDSGAQTAPEIAASAAEAKAPIEPGPSSAAPGPAPTAQPPVKPEGEAAAQAAVAENPAPAHTPAASPVTDMPSTPAAASAPAPAPAAAPATAPATPPAPAAEPQAASATSSPPAKSSADATPAEAPVAAPKDEG